MHECVMLEARACNFFSRRIVLYTRFFILLKPCVTESLWELHVRSHSLALFWGQLNCVFSGHLTCIFEARACDNATLFSRIFVYSTRFFIQFHYMKLFFEARACDRAVLYFEDIFIHSTRFFIWFYWSNLFLRHEHVTLTLVFEDICPVHALVHSILLKNGIFEARACDSAWGDSHEGHLVQSPSISEPWFGLSVDFLLFQ